MTIDDLTDDALYEASVDACHAFLAFGEAALDANHTLPGAPLTKRRKVAARTILNATRESLDADKPTEAQANLLKAMFVGVTVAARGMITELVNDGPVKPAKKVVKASKKEAK
jgi:hypothetical protein